jgi:hypothetical protein
VDVVLRYKDHSEWVQFAVTGLRKQDVILRYTWLTGELTHRWRQEQIGC